MKTKKLYCLAALMGAALAGGAGAQAQVMYDGPEPATAQEYPCDTKTQYFSSWKDNWFIEASAGMSIPVVERGMAMPEFAMGTLSHKKYTAGYSLGFGRWMSPHLALRFRGIYGPIHWDAPENEQESLSDEGWNHMQHAGLSMELMWDMFNSLGGVNPKRVFSLVPFFGLGVDASWDFHDKFGNEPLSSNVLRNNADKYKNKFKNVEWLMPAHAGLQLRFRLCKYLDFFAELRGTFYADTWNNYAIGESFDVLLSAMGGLTVNLGGADGGGRSWKSFNECDYVGQIAGLNDQINDLRTQLMTCGQTVMNLQAQLPCPELVQKDCKNAPLMATVRFLLNSYKILPTEEVSIYTMAEWLKANPEEKIIVAGYADRDTGTPDYNMQLSEKRANAVKNALVNEYGIDPSRLQIKFFGSDVQEYPSHNDWNRIVIFKQ